MYWNLDESRQNFEIIERYVELHSLRTSFLMNQLTPETGGDHYHSEGRRWFRQDDAEWQTFAAWVRSEQPRCLTY